MRLPASAQGDDDGITQKLHNVYPQNLLADDLPPAPWLWAVSQHAQYQDPETEDAKQNSAIIDFHYLNLSFAQWRVKMSVQASFIHAKVNFYKKGAKVLRGLWADLSRLLDKRI